MNSIRRLVRKKDRLQELQHWEDPPKNPRKSQLSQRVDFTKVLPSSEVTLKTKRRSLIWSQDLRRMINRFFFLSWRREVFKSKLSDFLMRKPKTSACLKMKRIRSSQSSIWDFRQK